MIETQSTHSSSPAIAAHTVASLSSANPTPAAAPSGRKRISAPTPMMMPSMSCAPTRDHQHASTCCPPSAGWC